MRYFRYPNTKKNIHNALSVQYKALSDEQRRIVRRRKYWGRVCMLVSCGIDLTCMLVGFGLLTLIPMPEAFLLKVFVIIAKVALGFVIVVISGVLTAALSMPLLKKAESYQLPAMRKEILSKACSHLRDYYGLREPYLITKCYDATDKKFRSHDVCLFVVGEELRITTDLVRGFLHGERDLGCYAFNREEISLSKLEYGTHLAAELRTDHAVFLLGYRAKGFVQRYFLEEGTE